VAMINVGWQSETWYYYYADALGRVRLRTDAPGVADISDISDGADISDMEARIARVTLEFLTALNCNSRFPPARE